MTELVLVPVGAAAWAWQHAGSYIRQAVERGMTDFAKVEAEVLSGRRQLWLVLDGKTIVGAAVTRLVTDGACEITALGTDPGAGHNHFHLIDRIEDFARAEGCDAVRIIGRPGWQRALPGYAPKAVILERALR